MSNQAKFAETIAANRLIQSHVSSKFYPQRASRKNSRAPVFCLDEKSSGKILKKSV
jgi:hypothetical protein